jgi:hypothetical protein
MSKRLYPHKRIKYWYAYSIDDICALYAEFGLHAQTVRKWIKDGLKTTDKGKPSLIYGYFLIEFLKKQNSKNKCKTAFDEMFCLACQDARSVFQRKAVIEKKAQTLSLSGQCRECKTTMFKFYKMTDYPDIKRAFQLVEVLELYDCEASLCKTHIQDHAVTPISESTIGTVYGDLFE